MSMSDAEVASECEAALGDAGFTAEQVRLFKLDLGAGHVGAAWFRPGMQLEPDPRMFPGTDDQLAEANRPENCHLHRVAVPSDPQDPVLFAGLLRHELEHARQWDCAPEVFDLQDFLENDVLVEIAGGLDGCGGWLINTIPSEIDCNAAASVYLATRFGSDEVQAVRNGPHKYLVCSLLPPPSPETLPARMVAFAYVHLSGVEQHAARRGFPSSSILRSIDAAAADLWTRLESRDA